MREFQKVAIAEVARRLSSGGIKVEWKEKIVGPLPVLNYGPDDVDLSTSFDMGGRNYQIWVYPDGLHLQGPGVSENLEWQDFPGDPDGQIHKFSEILLREIENARARSSPQ